MSDTAPLTLDAAVGLLDAAQAPEPDETADAPVETTESEAEPTAEDAPDPEEAIEGDPEGDEPDPAQPAIEAPQSWAAEDRETWDAIPREAQEVILARETDRDRATQKAVQDAAAARKAAETEFQYVGQLKAATEQVLNRVGEQFKGKWDNVDWTGMAQNDPAAYVRWKAEYDAEQTALAQLQAVNRAQADAAEQAQRAQYQAFQRQKIEDLKTLAPELIEPTKGTERIHTLERFLTQDLGVDPAILETLDAKVIKLAWDGFRYQQAQKTAAKQPPAQTQRPVRPAAAQPVQSQQRAAQAIKNRFAQTGSFDDALAVMNSRTK